MKNTPNNDGPDKTSPHSAKPPNSFLIMDDNVTQIQVDYGVMRYLAPCRRANDVLDKIFTGAHRYRPNLWLVAMCQ